MKTLLLYLLALLFVTQSVLSQTTRYVNAGGCGANSPCYSTIQAAINASVTGDIIQVASGTYNEALTIGISLDLEGASVGTTVVNASGLNLHTISITAGTVKIRKFCIKEDNANTKSCLYVTGGTVDAGTVSDKGLNQFLVYGAGSAIDNEQSVALNAIGNYWGSAKGPTISTNYCGNGGAITSTGASLVSYSPWKDDELFSNDVTPGGPVTTASSLTVCAGTTIVDIPITVASFTNVGVISLKLAYDATKLGSAALLSQQAALWGNFAVNTATSGTILVSGYGTGITLSGTPTLFTLRFTKATPITNGTLTFVENVQGTSCEYAPDAPPLYAPFCDKPTGTYYIPGGVTVYNTFTAGGITTTGETICYNGNPGSIGSTIDAGGGDGTISYQWQSSTDAGFTSPTNISSNTATYDPPAGLMITTWYRRQAKDGTCNTSWNTSTGAWKVTVYNNFTAGSIATTGETICYNGNPGLIGSTIDAGGGDGTISYQWQSSTDAGFTSPTNISSNTATYDPPAGLTITTWYRRQAKDGTCNTSWNISTGVWKVTVRNQFTAGSIETTGETICYGSDPGIIGSLTPSGGGDETITYQWQSSTDAGFTSPTDISSNTSTYNPPSGLTVTTWYRRQAKDGTCNASWNTSSGVWKVTVNALQSITGNITYYNLDFTPLTNYITVRLYRGGSLVGSDSIQPSHTSYAFNNLCPGTYELRASSTLSTDGSVNTTDAAQENWWGVYPYTIEQAKFYAGDVAGDFTYPDFNNYLNATDAHLIQQNFVYQTPFDRLNTWTFWRAGETFSLNPSPCGDMQYPTVTLQPGSDLTVNIYALCTGDFNCSYDPLAGKSGKNNLQLTYGTTRLIGADQEFDLPVRIVNPTGVGAISMILDLPAGLVEVKDVLIDGTGGQLDWAVKDNELRIGWNSLTPLDLGAASNLLTLRLKTTAAFTEGASIRISLVSNPGNELADDHYNPIGNAAISVDVITASPVGIEEQPADNGVTLNNHPNPFNSYTIIKYLLPSEGFVTLEIRDLLGKTVKGFVNEIQSKGIHSLKFDAIDLIPGIYMATLRFCTASDELRRTIKLVRYK